MTGQCQCGICGAQTPDAFICDRCLDLVRDLVAEVAWLHWQLEVTASRQAKLGNAVKRALGAEQPLPYRPHAAELARELWVYLERRLGQFRQPRELLHRLDQLSRRPDAANFYRGLKRYRDEALEAINAREPWTYCGPCPTCRRDLYAKPGTAQARCTYCGEEFNVDKRREWMLSKSMGHIDTATVIVNALRAMVDVKLTYRQIGDWAAKGWLHDYGVEVRQGRARKLYRIGDVVSLAAIVAKTEQARRAKRAG